MCTLCNSTCRKFLIRLTRLFWLYDCRFSPGLIAIIVRMFLRGVFIPIYIPKCYIFYFDCKYSPWQRWRYHVYMRLEQLSCFFLERKWFFCCCFDAYSGYWLCGVFDVCLSAKFILSTFQKLTFCSLHPFPLIPYTAEHTHCIHFYVNKFRYCFFSCICEFVQNCVCTIW